MGVYHFATVGRWPGAVTTALAYLKHHKDEMTTRGSVIDSVVLFTTPEIANGVVKTPEVVFNDYLSFKAPPKKLENLNAVDVVVKFIEREIAPAMDDDGKVYSCILEDHGDYQACFETVARAALNFSRPGHTGKQIWANLTGGTNVVNAALHQIASLSGLISKLYYVFQPEESHRKYLQPPSAEPDRFRWEEVSLIKTAIDPVYYELLQVLDRLEDKWYLDEEIFSRLRQVAHSNLPRGIAEWVITMPLQRFEQEYLNKMDERTLKRQEPKSRAVRISDEGREWLRKLRSPLYQMLIHRGRSFEAATYEAESPKPNAVWDPKMLTEGLRLKELWSKPKSSQK